MLITRSSSPRESRCCSPHLESDVSPEVRVEGFIYSLFDRENSEQVLLLGDWVVHRGGVNSIDLPAGKDPMNTIVKHTLSLGGVVRG